MSVSMIKKSKLIAFAAPASQRICMSQFHNSRIGFDAVMWINAMIQYSKLTFDELKNDTMILDVLISSVNKLTKCEILPSFIFESSASERLKMFYQSCQTNYEQANKLLQEGKANRASLLYRSNFYPSDTLLNLFYQYLEDSSIKYTANVQNCSDTLVQLLNQKEIDYILSFDPYILLQMPETILYQCSSDFHTIQIVFSDLLNYYKMDQNGFWSMIILTGELHPQLKVCSIAQFVKYSGAYKNIFDIISYLRLHGHKVPLNYEDEVKKIFPLNSETHIEVFSERIDETINEMPKPDLITCAQMQGKEQKDSSQVSPKSMHSPGQMNLFGEIVEDPSPKRTKSPTKKKTKIKTNDIMSYFSSKKE